MARILNGFSEENQERYYTKPAARGCPRAHFLLSDRAFTAQKERRTWRSAAFKNHARTHRPTSGRVQSGEENAGGSALLLAVFYSAVYSVLMPSIDWQAHAGGGRCGYYSRILADMDAARALPLYTAGSGAGGLVIPRAAPASRPSARIRRKRR